MTINTGDTIATAFTNAGFDVTIANGKLVLVGDDNLYLTAMSSTLRTALNIGNGALYTDTQTFTNTTDNQQINVTTTTQVETPIVGSSTLDVTPTPSGPMYVTVSQGTEHELQFTTSNTVDELIASLAMYGINASISGGEFSLGSSTSYVKSMDSGLMSFLKLDGSFYTTHTGTYDLKAAPLTAYVDAQIELNENTRIGDISAGGISHASGNYTSLSELSMDGSPTYNGT